ncbi:hypothetical protein BU23DRAFT_7620 [Bimuria novae-zelandiae CBS 107.79]|uniref:Uncharacterized protein n=1 Tax=Bimuria novae-zelandiae CBS 107.79 TaxID=1447943 RepID=A0A6A5VZV1_9PLEO|nr:hypothetical protein BU23DRAFT_7620 [Bimuria novae-zelandiae CBS 107.79]
MPSTSIEKGKARAETPDRDTRGALNSTLTPPRTPPRRPQAPIFTPTKRSANTPPPVTPSASTTLLTPTSKRTRLEDYGFSSTKKPTNHNSCTSPTKRAEENAAKKRARKIEREIKDDTDALLKDLEKEERENEREAQKRQAAEDKEAAQQLKREAKKAKESEDLAKRRVIDAKNNYYEWRRNNRKPGATFKLPGPYDRDSYRNARQCRDDYSLVPDDLKCLAHCMVPNTRDQDWCDEKWFCLVDVEKLVGRKAAMMAGIECSDEKELIGKGWEIIREQQKAKDTEEAS